MRKYLTEFIGTFFLVATIGLTVTAGLQLAPVAIGAALMVMVYMGGHVSGAHYNPAVSLAALMRGSLPAAEFLPYLIAQLAGSIVAALVVNVLTGQTFAPAPGASATTTAALLSEMLFTFALALVVLNAATSAKTQNNSFYGLAIGMTVMVGAFAVGGISGGAFNPAVGTGPTIVNALIGGGSWSHLWLYLVGPFAGAAIAALVFRIQEV
jgi:aquaporin Z